MPPAPDNRITLILDTNLFIAANWAPSSASARLIGMCIEGIAVAHYSPEIRREVEHMLGKALRQARGPALDEYLRSLEPFWEKAVEVEGRPTKGIQADDPDDQKFLEAALGGGTDLIVTNDDHLLRIGYIGRTEIVTPKTALHMLGLA